MAKRAKHLGEVCKIYPNCVNKKTEHSLYCVDCGIRQSERLKSMEENTFNNMTTELDKLYSIMKKIEIWPCGENSADKILYKSFSGNWVHRDPLTQDRTVIEYEHALFIAKGIALKYIQESFDGKAYLDNDGEYVLGEGTEKYAGRTSDLKYAIELAYNINKQAEA